MGGNVKMWDAWCVPGAAAVCIMPHSTKPCGVTAEHPGTAGEHDVRTANYFHMQQYVNMFFKGMWHSQWVGYRMPFYTLDPEFHALDLYHQSPP